LHTHNETLIRTPVDLALRVAADVERWPKILPHYREVRFTRRDADGCGRVYMAAYRHFGPIPYPTWWESEMVTDRDAAEIRYRHVDGITRGMDVLWKLEPVGPAVVRDAHNRDSAPTGGRMDGDERSLTRVVVTHDWEGPSWPLIGGFAARAVIGPHFIRVVADRTLAGVRREAERLAGSPSEEAAGSDGGGERP
jgi:ribosome-associated toxin RatA of RatAB toxin-antitoxin module